MPLRNFLLTLHIFGAIFGFGPTFVIPFIGRMAQKEGAPVATLLEVMDFITNKITRLVSLTLQPGTGAGLIIVSKGLWDPFEARNRWLLVAIILFIIATIIAEAGATPSDRKALTLAKAGQFGPEFAATVKRSAMFGQMLTVILFTIIILMVVKPGSGYIHP